MSNLVNKNKNLLVENIIVFFLFTVFLVFKSLKTLSKIFSYGIFITASDSEIFKMARSASILCTTPRVGLNTINKSNVLLDGLIGSNLDPGEVFSFSELSAKPKYTIKTEGEKGGKIFPGGRYEALKNKKLKIDSYGCGDSFAAGILYGMASKWDIDKSLNLAKILGRNASEFFGPYEKKIRNN